MIVDTITEIKNKLRIEQWTVKDISNITINDFGALDKVIEQIDSEQNIEEVLNILETQLQSAPKNISALYSASLIKLKNKSMDDSQVINLLALFHEHKRWGLLAHLCTKFLVYGNNRHILRMLSTCYENTAESQKQIDVWEKLVKIDFTETDIVLQLAQEYANRNQQSKAIEFYKKLILRSISNANFDMTHTGWNALVNLIPQDLGFFLQVENSVGKKFTIEQVLLLLEHIYPYYKKSKDWDNAVTILKRVFDYQPENAWARKELIKCYREKYSAHSNLDESLKSANISQSWRNIHEAITDFEKHISFDRKNFVFHRTWGVGLIREIERDKILIDFSKHKSHAMSLKMAMTALEILPKNHIWVLRSAIPNNKLAEMVKNNVSQTLKIIIHSFGNAVTMKKIRAELVPYILSDSEWTSWNVKARQILKTDGIFGTIADLPDHYEVRSHRSTLTEKSYNSFSSEKNFASRIKIVLGFLKLPDFDINDSDVELISEITNYFTTFIELEEQDVVIRISSILILRLLSEKFPSLQVGSIIAKYPLTNIVSNVQVASQICQQIENKELLNYFILTIGSDLDNEIWTGVYLDILRHSPSKFILDTLEKKDKITEAIEIIKRICTSYRTHREAFVWLVMHASKYIWVQEALPDEEKLIIAMAHLYDINAVDISNKRHLSANRKNQGYINKYLYKEMRLNKLIDTADELVILQLIPILHELQKIEPAITLTQKSIISTRFPHLEKDLDQRVHFQKTSKKSGFFCLSLSFHAKQKELQHIHEVDVPLNSKEIQAAVEMGDLRENAEYKSAKERQEILNANAMRLDNEIRQAKIIESDKFEDAKIGFGSEVSLIDMRDSTTLSYTILGPWESDPSNNIISYLSPLGTKLFGHVPNDELVFSINDVDYRLRVMDIKKSILKQT